MEPPADAIKIIENMCFNLYNNSRGRRNMKRVVSHVEDEAGTFGLGQQIQALS